MEPKAQKKDWEFMGFLTTVGTDTPKNTPSKRRLLLDVVRWQCMSIRWSACWELGAVADPQNILSAVLQPVRRLLLLRDSSGESARKTAGGNSATQLTRIGLYIRCLDWAHMPVLHRVIQLEETMSELESDARRG